MQWLQRGLVGQDARFICEPFGQNLQDSRRDLARQFQVALRRTCLRENPIFEKLGDVQAACRRGGVEES
jgi:hypothetical protein